VIPERLLLRNFMCYREDLPVLEFDGLHVACLSGDNGSGKSALLDAITWALWGRARLGADDDLVAQGAQEMEVDFQFTLEGQSYRVIRKRSRAKRGQSWLDFQAQNGAGWKVLTEATLRETQQAITGLLRIDYDTFINSAFLVQGRADEFTSRKKPAERKQVLAEILGLTVYDELQQAAREQAAGFEKQAFGKQTLIAELQRKADDGAKYHALLDESEARVAAVERDLAAAEALHGQVAEQRRLLAAQVEMLRDAQRQQSELEAECAAIEADLAALALRTGETEGLQARREQIVAGLAQFEAAEHEVARLDQLLPQYEALAEMERAASQQIAEEERVLRAELTVARAALEALGRRAEEREHTAGRVLKGEQVLSELAPLRAELSELRARRAELGRHEAALRDLERQRHEAETKVQLRLNSLVASREEAQRTQRRLEERLAEQPRWQKLYDAAHHAAGELEATQARLAEERAAEADEVAAVGALRAECVRIEQAGIEGAEKIKLLDHEGASCPLCQSDLGHHGLERVRARYEQEREELRALLRATRQQASARSAALTQRRATLAQLEQRCNELSRTAAQAEALEQRLREAAADRAELRRQSEIVQSIVDQLDNQTYAEVERQQLAAIERQIAASGASGGTAELRAAIAEVDERARELEQRSSEFERFQGSLEALREKLAALDAELTQLPEAQARTHELENSLAGELFAAAARRHLRDAEDQIVALGYSRAAHEDARGQARALRHWRDEAQRLQAADALLGELQAQRQRALESLRRRSAERATLQERILQLGQAARELGPIEQREREVASQIAALRVQRDVVVGDRVQYRQRLADTERAAEQLMLEQLALRAICEQQSLYEELALSFGKKGVQAMLIETAIPEIEQEANRLLGRMTDNQMHLTFETQRDTKKGDTVETLEIKIADSLGTRAYEAFSGGEAFRVNFAVRVALARLLARRTGATLETLVIDEGFGTQDAKGRERLVDAITSVQHDFRRILVVTHIQELKDLFPVQIEINKTESGSVWSVS
jgi:DNA repair protein SbcC/Rad50